MAKWQYRWDKGVYFDHALMRLALESKSVLVDIDLLAQRLEITRAQTIATLRSKRYTGKRTHALTSPGHGLRNDLWIQEVFDMTEIFGRTPVFKITVILKEDARWHQRNPLACSYSQAHRNHYEANYGKRDWSAYTYDCEVEIKPKITLAEVKAFLTVTA